MQYKTLQNVKLAISENNLPVHFVTIDGLCQHEIREAFGISEISLPNIGIYVFSKRKGARLVGTFNSNDIFTFIQGVLRGKIETFDLPKLTYSERDCSALSEPESNETDDDILQEILQEAENKKTNPSQKASDTKRGRRKKSSKKSEDL